MHNSYIPQALKDRVREEAQLVCEYCLALSAFAFHNFSIDHIFPLSLGGLTILENLAYCCQHCNNAKYNKTNCIDPLSNVVVPLFHPRQEEWADHFVWTEDKSVVIGITPSGRATVSCLKMNREEAISLRRALAEFGVHPPF